MIDHLSYSSISTYLMCPRSWRFRYLDKVEAPTSPALIFGSAFHEAIEGHIADRHTAPGISLIDRWETAWSTQLESKGNNVAWGKDSTESLHDLGHAMLSDPGVQGVIEAIRPVMHKGQALIEEKVELRVPGVPMPVIGYVDVIEEGGVPADFKTSARSWSQNRAHEELQATFYLAALNQMQTPLNLDMRFRYYVFVKNARRPQVEIRDTQRTAADLFWLFGLIRDVWGSIEAGAFPPNPNTWKCSPKWCEYWEVCRG